MRVLLAAKWLKHQMSRQALWRWMSIHMLMKSSQPRRQRPQCGHLMYNRPAIDHLRASLVVSFLFVGELRLSTWAFRNTSRWICQSCAVMRAISTDDVYRGFVDSFCLHEVVGLYWFGIDLVNVGIFGIFWIFIFCALYRRSIDNVGTWIAEVLT